MKEKLLYLFIDLLRIALTTQLDKLRSNERFDRLQSFTDYAEKREQKYSPPQG